jgi:DNA-binding transcriptional LysR family regulator
MPALTNPGTTRIVESSWFHHLSGGATPALVSNLTLALLEAARSSAGIAVLPRYIGDAESALVHLPMPDEPREPIWITVHKDLRKARRVRAVLDHLNACIANDQAILLGM